eukprot:3228138-Rhodomonas_salina.2
MRPYARSVRLRARSRTPWLIALYTRYASTANSTPYPRSVPTIRYGSTGHGAAAYATGHTL